MDIKIKTILKWLVVTNILVTALPVAYMLMHDVVDVLLITLTMLGFGKLTFAIIMSVVLRVDARDKELPSQRDPIKDNKWIT